MECPVCLEGGVRLVTFAPCGHGVCAECFRKCAAHGHAHRCVTCRQTVVSRVGAADPACKADRAVNLVLTVRTSRGPAGVTVAGYDRGLRVVRVQDQAFAAGLRAGDTIVRMNGMRVTHHERGASVLDTSVRHRLDVTCAVHRPGRCVWCFLMPKGGR